MGQFNIKFQPVHLLMLNELYHAKLMIPSEPQGRKHDEDMVQHPKKTALLPIKGAGRFKTNAVTSENSGHGG